MSCATPGVQYYICKKCKSLKDENFLLKNIKGLYLCFCCNGNIEVDLMDESENDKT